MDGYTDEPKPVTSVTFNKKPIPYRISGWVRCLVCNEGAPKAAIINGLCIVCEEELTDDQKERIAVQQEGNRE